MNRNNNLLQNSMFPPANGIAAHQRSSLCSPNPPNAILPRSQSSIATRTMKKSVTFGTNTRNCIIPSCLDMDEAQKESIWRTDEDIKNNDQEIMKTARAIIKKTKKSTTTTTQNDADDDTASICARGLECLVIGSDARRRREQHKLELIDAVLDAQDSQWKMGNYHADPDILRAASETHSYEDVCRALTLAAADEAFVRREHNKRRHRHRVQHRM